MKALHCFLLLAALLSIAVNQASAQFACVRDISTNVEGSITGDDNAQLGRIVRDGKPSTCVGDTGTLENNKGNLMGWVSDPSGVKPGTRMPPNPMSPEDLEALAAYLQSLK